MELSRYTQSLHPTPSQWLPAVATGNQLLCYIWERVPTKQCETEEKAWVSCTTAHSQREEDTRKKKEERKKIPLTLNSNEQLLSSGHNTYVHIDCKLCGCVNISVVCLFIM